MSRDFFGFSRKFSERQTPLRVSLQLGEFVDIGHRAAPGVDGVDVIDDGRVFLHGSGPFVIFLPFTTKGEKSGAAERAGGFRSPMGAVAFLWRHRPVVLRPGSRRRGSALKGNQPGVSPSFFVYENTVFA